MPKFKTWLSAFRLRTLPLATAGIVLGSLLAAAEHALRWRVAALCLVTAVVLQILSNLANDYGDSVHGADSENRVGPRRATQAGHISVAAMRRAVLVFAGLGLAAGYVLIRDESLVFHAAGLAAIAAAVTYTLGPRPYGYAGLGDIFVLVFFGVVAVFGTYYLHTHNLNYHVLWPACSCGLFSVAVLNINNIRDRRSDKIAGKITIPVRIGERKARLYHWTLLITGAGCAVVFVLLEFRTYWQFLFFLSLPLILKNGLFVARTQAAQLDPCLKQMAIATLVFAFSFGLGGLF
ncbi:MAG: 1,4-dihydroxy-2-naphthoate polyprenyltransferase [bacterium]